MTELPVSRIEKVRVLIAEDRVLIGESLATVLTQQNDDFEMLACAADGEQVIKFTRRYWPNVILMDLQMPRVDGITVIRRILREFPRINIIVLTTFETSDLISEAVSAGAKAYLLKDAKVDEIAMTIRAVMNGQSWLSPGVAARILDEFKRLRRPRVLAKPTLCDSLTARENEILKLIAEGKSNTEIAERLYLAEGTVKNYVSTILEKCQVKNRTELAIKSVTY
jgi:DNA-binding NarL/FixJ family response regulator